MKFEKEIATVLQSIQPDTDMIDVMKALGYGSDQFEQAFEIAREMDNQNLVKLLYSNFNTQKVVVEITLLAKK